MSMQDTAALRSYPLEESVAMPAKPDANKTGNTPDNSQAGKQTIRDCVECSMRNYFHHLDGHDATNLYEMVMAEVEAPLLRVVLEYTRDNQSRAAEVLGLNRGTLRKKMKAYGLL